LREPRQFRKKPVVIEAIQWNGINYEAVGKFLRLQEHDIRNLAGSSIIIIHTLEGDMTASIGDWIIKGVRGEFYPCKHDVFEATYELEIEQ